MERTEAVEGAIEGGIAVEVAGRSFPTLGGGPRLDRMRIVNAVSIKTRRRSSAGSKYRTLHALCFR